MAERLGQRHDGDGSAGSASDERRLADARERARELLAAADEAVGRVLSSDSEAFLRATRQDGGQ